MDDVIFAGTAGRPSRAPGRGHRLPGRHRRRRAAAVPSRSPELQVSRQIERGSGSTYRVNGKEVRARDVQTLFADLASGARASAMVSQGRVGALVGARPEDRRMVLEEAAGITGLHARRHEAELKLRAAEANLARAEDLRGQLESQLAGLKRQARQASRYRNLSGAIRSAEAELLSILRARAEAARDAAGAALHRGAGGCFRRRPRPSVHGRRAGHAKPQRNCRHCAIPRQRPAPSWNGIGSRRSRSRTRRAAPAPRWPKPTRRLEQLGRDLTHAEQLSRDAAAAEASAGSRGSRLAEAAASHETRADAAECRGSGSGGCGPRGRGRSPSCDRSRRRGECPPPGGNADCCHRLSSVPAVPAEQSARLQDERRPDRRASRSTRRGLPRRAKSRQQAEAALAAARAALDAAEQARAAAAAAWPRHGKPSPAPNSARATAGRRGTRAVRSAGGAGWRALAADGRCADCARRTGNGAGRGAGRGTDLRAEPRRRAALARAAAVRPGPGTAGRRDTACRAWFKARRHWHVPCRRSAWSMTGRNRRFTTVRSGTRPGSGLPRRRDLALGWLYHSGRHADRGRGSTAAAQPAGEASIRAGSGGAGRTGGDWQRASKPKPLRRLPRPRNSAARSRAA